MVSSPVWLIHVTALVPAPKAHWEWLPGPGSVAWARLRACAWAVFDCDSNCAAWHFPQTALPAYPEAVSSAATGMAQPAITSAARHRREIGVDLAVTGILPSPRPLSRRR